MCTSVIFIKLVMFYMGVPYRHTLHNQILNSPTNSNFKIIDSSPVFQIKKQTPYIEKIAKISVGGAIFDVGDCFAALGQCLSVIVYFIS